MAHSLAEALAQAKIVKPEKAALVEEMRRMHLRQMERAHASAAAGRAFQDEVAVIEERRNFSRASRETVRSGGDTRSKAYLDRFRK